MARYRAVWWFLLALVGTALGACGGGHQQDANGGTGGPALPIRLLAANGAVTIPHEPTRIVSLSPTATEDLYAVGAGRQVVAVDAYSNYPPQAPRTQLTESSPDVEAIAKYRPDLVVLSEDTDQISAQLHKLQIPVIVEPPATGLAVAYQQIAQLGQATGHGQAAGPVINRIRDEISSIVRSVPRPRRPLRVYHELEQTFYSATSQSFIGRIYAMLGLSDIADAAHGAGPYPQLSAEYIIASDPNLIVLADADCCKQSAATVTARPGWNNIAAVKSGAIISVDDAIASRWGPRVVLFVRSVAAAVKRLEEGSG